jgi:hypothetical protein
MARSEGHLPFFLQFSVQGISKNRCFCFGKINRLLTDRPVLFLFERRAIVIEDSVQIEKFVGGPGDSVRFVGSGVVTRDRVSSPRQLWDQMYLRPGSNSEVASERSRRRPLWQRGFAP